MTEEAATKSPLSNSGNKKMIASIYKRIKNNDPATLKAKPKPKHSTADAIIEKIEEKLWKK